MIFAFIFIQYMHSISAAFFIKTRFDFGQSTDKNKFITGDDGCNVIIFIKSVPLSLY